MTMKGEEKSTFLYRDVESFSCSLVWHAHTRWTAPENCITPLSQPSATFAKDYKADDEESLIQSILWC